MVKYNNSHRKIIFLKSPSQDFISTCQQTDIIKDQSGEVHKIHIRLEVLKIELYFEQNDD